MGRLTRVTRHGVLLLWLTVVWLGLWGNLSAANLLAGLAVGAALLLLLPLPEQASQGGIRPLALLRFLLFFANELVKASLQVVVQVLHPRRELQQAVLAVPVTGASDRLLTVVANAISLTPGTLTLEVDRERATLYVHALDVGGPGGVDAVRDDILRLERLAILALGSQECLQALDAAVREARS
jgi:multicomponent Na+:H+ antiporter subunit E